jgi:hypothetical protein
MVQNNVKQPTFTISLQVPQITFGRSFRKWVQHMHYHKAAILPLSMIVSSVR